MKLFKRKKRLENNKFSDYNIGQPIFALSESDRSVLIGIIRKIDKVNGSILAYFPSQNQLKLLVFKRNNWYID